MLSDIIQLLYKGILVQNFQSLIYEKIGKPKRTKSVMYIIMIPWSKTVQMTPQAKWFSLFFFFLCFLFAEEPQTKVLEVDSSTPLEIMPTMHYESWIRMDTQLKTINIFNILAVPSRWIGLYSTKYYRFSNYQLTFLRTRPSNLGFFLCFYIMISPRIESFSDRLSLWWTLPSPFFRLQNCYFIIFMYERRNHELD